MGGSMWFIILTDLREKKKKTEDPINRCKESIKKMKETSIYGKFQVDLE